MHLWTRWINGVREVDVDVEGGEGWVGELGFSRKAQMRLRGLRNPAYHLMWRHRLGSRLDTIAGGQGVRFRRQLQENGVREPRDALAVCCQVPLRHLSGGTSNACLFLPAAENSDFLYTSCGRHCSLVAYPRPATLPIRQAVQNPWRAADRAPGSEKGWVLRAPGAPGACLLCESQVRV